MADETQYSNRELDRMFSEILSVIKNQDRTLERIEVQTIKTNGRVTNLETEIANEKIWRSGILGRMWGIGASISIVWSILFTIIGAVIKKYI